MRTAGGPGSALAGAGGRFDGETAPYAAVRTVALSRAPRARVRDMVARPFLWFLSPVAPSWHIYGAIMNHADTINDTYGATLWRRVSSRASAAPGRSNA